MDMDKGCIVRILSLLASESDGYIMFAKRNNTIVVTFITICGLRIEVQN